MLRLRVAPWRRCRQAVSVSRRGQVGGDIFEGGAGRATLVSSDGLGSIEIARHPDFGTSGPLRPVRAAPVNEPNACSCFDLRAMQA